MSTPSPVVYGIDNCDTVRKARQWLKAHAIEYRFHDFRRDGLDTGMLARWLTHVPWDALLNRRGLTWRRLDEPVRARVVDQPSAVELMVREPTLIKRPVYEQGERLIVGFSDALYSSLLRG